MNEALSLILALARGAILGLIFFGGLWWTVQKIISSKHPSLWFFGSIVIRMSIAIAGFYFISQGRWQKLFLCLVGFIFGRFIVMQLTRRPSDKEAHHAP